MEKPFQIVITGASGFVAKNLRKYLSENNVHLISISRKNFKSFKNETKIILKNYDQKSLLPKIKNSDALIHLVGIGKQSVKIDYESINFQLTQKIVNLSKKAKIKKIIYTSGLGVSPDTSLGYFVSKFKAEQSIIDSKINYTIFRPSYIVGKDDLFTKYLKKSIEKNKIIIPGSGKYFIQPIFINDVTKLIFQSIRDKKFNNKIIDLVGSEKILFEKYIQLFLQKRKTKLCYMDIEKAYRLAITDSKFDYGVDDLNILVGNFVGDYKKLRNLSKMDFQSVKELLKAGALF
ncbi:NADH dehydrogenase protein [Marine Group I thaumarchaeote SCGC RSA3]|uniref:NADH dehydrogenase protein n=3 Tax=Marine Group I TaxID=905826 RepID=A0A081RQE1_9ARCH|nr:NADH dehydrogenase protein [Marine Group I thaumarchaeote SCGC AAA799-N04]KFM14493.1 NADH dehydrogenase protein [Marine Group I thaumarchaeote SCGC AAA799-D11]KFM20691.1 NADH dehydrogenase protein [Marine Group I thaumarchaeote SCGC RSA3]